MSKSNKSVCFKSILIKIFVGSSLFFLLGFLLFGVFYFDHKNKLELVEKEWNLRKIPIPLQIGTTETLSILPLINWHSFNSNLKTELGVSYLIKIDNHNILFDLGQNRLEEDPSPLEHNMNLLNIDHNDIDTIFISHGHFDHVGGRKWEKAHTFSFGNQQRDLSRKLIFASSALQYPGAVVKEILEPSLLFEGVASLGPIPRKLFIGRIDEQALVINIKNKGLVIISGCGHQTLPKILQRVKESFSEPIYGIIGDLHYPVPSGRLNILGLNAQLLFASGTDPFQPISSEEIESEINSLKELKLGVIGLGGHDSSDEVISQFKETFGHKFHTILVGKWIHIAQSFKTK
jgi:7,8-dihydropterin-6-yl-methyl-4-(beta-D-ribofuranosyl)aminobenzene 5'-phosphate synthase